MTGDDKVLLEAILSALWFINWVWVGVALYRDTTGLPSALVAVLIMAPIASILIAIVQMILCLCVAAGIHAIILGIAGGIS